MSYSNNQIAFTGNRPMCGHGVKVNSNESRESIINSAGLDWSIVEQPLRYELNGKQFEDTSKKVLLNGTSGELLHVASSRFKPVQPAIILNSYFNIIENMGFEMEVIGQIDNGKKIFARAKAPNNLNINGDKIEGYLTLATGNDGTMATIANIGGNRLACMNETPMLFKGQQAHRTRHNTTFNPNTMMNDLGLVEFNQHWSDFEETVQGLIDTRISSRDAISFIHGLVGTKKPIEEESTKTTNKIKQIYNNIINSAGANLSTCNGNLWGLFNGISYYTDHQIGTNENNRAKGLLMGDGLKLKNNALELLDMKVKSNAEFMPQNNALELLNIAH